jgi:prepilin-type N-terminal cleavage/methylation domain-containing protein
MRPSRRQSKLGFTMVEILTAMVIVGMLATFALPRLVRLRDQGQVASATTRFTRAVMAARQAAIQRGKHAYFKHNNSSIWVIVDTTGINSDSVVITATQNLATLYGVSVVSPSGLTSIEYDPRGVSAQASKQVFAFKHTNSGLVDSLCISKLGNTIRDRCP